MLSDTSYCNVNGEKDASIKLSYKNGSIEINDISKRTKCYLYFDKYSAIDTIIGDTTNIEEKTEFTGIATSADTGIYSAPDDYGTSYYFRGVENELNNWVKFGDFYWRIIRINGNGTVRMIYQGVANGNVSSANKTGTTTQINGTTYTYNSISNDNTYVGYMNNGASTTSYDTAHQNLLDSNAKSEIDKWYKTNIDDKELSTYIDANTGFCNDREIADAHTNYTGGGYGTGKTVYKSIDKIMTTNLNSYKVMQTPTLQCTNKTRDLFTVNNSNSENKGNKKLTYPVGMIISDEIIFAGGFGGAKNNMYYLYTNQHYWTMSPSIFDSENKARVCYAALTGNITFGNYVNWSDSGLRPIINLKANTQFTYNNESTKGSETDPFVVV